MTNTVVSQAHKIGITSGGDNTPSHVSQAHKIILLSVGSVPSIITQAHKIAIIRVGADGPDPPPGGAGRRRGFMNFVP
jgi:hypothetical protein